MKLIEVNPGFSSEIGLLNEAASIIAQPDAFEWSEAVKPSVWQAYSGIEAAKEAVIALENVTTPEQYIRAKALAQAAIEELRKAVVMAEGATGAAEAKAVEMTGSAEAIGDPGVMDIVKNAVAKVKASASKVITAAKSVASKVVAKAKTVASAAVTKAKELMGTAKAKVAVTSGQKAAAKAAAEGGAKGYATCPKAKAKTLTTEQAKYGAQEYKRWTGKEITPEAYSEAMTIPEAEEPGIVERTKAWFWDRWHGANLKLHECFTVITGARAVWTRCQGIMNRLSALAPSIRSSAWLAKYERLKARWIVIDRDFHTRLTEYNQAAKGVKEQEDAELKAGKPLSGGETFGRIGYVIPWPLISKLAIIVGGIITAIMAWKALAVKWETDARIVEAEAAALLSEAQKTAYDTEKEKMDIAQTGIETRTQEIEQLEKEYQAAVEAGDKEKADAILAEIGKKQDEIALLEERAIAPFTPVIPTVPAAAAEEKPAEPSWMEKLFGIKPGSIMMFVVGMVFLWILAKVVTPTILEVKKAKAEIRVKEAEARAKEAKIRD